jgi:curli biogenesis system outer membrane secretion channel CsgG
MRQLRIIFQIFLLSCFVCSASGQVIEGVVLGVEDGKVFVDLKKDQVKVGDVLKVLKAGGVMVHPVTGEKIQRKDEVIANISLTQVNETYSVGEVYPKTAIDLIKTGLKVFTMGVAEADRAIIKKTMIIPPFLIVGGKVGELGTYMADLMTEELFKLDRFRIMDRQSYDIQQFEKELTQNNQKIVLPGNEGVDYLIMGSAYPPDVVEKATGIPLKGLATLAGGGIAGAAAKGIVPDLKIKELEAVVKFTLKVIDVRTGEVLFICSEMAKAEGKTQVSLESSVLGGAVLNGGATDFRNTLTGQASQEALLGSAKYIADFFEGKITDKSFQGNVIELKRRKGKEPPPVGMIDIRESAEGWDGVLNAGSDRGIRPGYYYLVTMPDVVVSSITGKKKVAGERKAGMFKPARVDFDAASGPIKLFPEFQDNHSDVIKSGKIMAYKPFRATMAFNFYGIPGDGFGDLEAGIEYFPNLRSMKIINYNLWVGLRGMYGFSVPNTADSSLVMRVHGGGEILLGLNPLRKSFEFNGFDPYVGLKYKFFKSEFADSGPGFFLGINLYGFFTEFAVIYGRQADMKAIDDPSFSRERVIFGFSGLGMHFGYRFIMNKLAL